MEVWKQIIGYEYEVSNKGRVRGMARVVIGGRFFTKRNLKPRLLRPSITRGRHAVILCKDNQLKGYLVHRLVGMAFIPNPNNFPCINHIDCNPSNNNVENLEWVTYQLNSIHARKHNLIKQAKGEQMGSAKLTEKQVLYMRKHWNPHEIGYRFVDFRKKYKVSKEAVRKAIIGESWKYLL